MFGLHRCRSNVLAELAFGDLAAGRPRQLVEHLESLGQQFLGNALLQQVFDECGQVEVSRVVEFGDTTQTLSPNTGSGIATAAATATAGWVVTASSTCDGADVLAAAQDEVRGSAGQLR